MTCDGCNLPDPVERLWLSAPVQDERLMRAVQDYAADWRRSHKREGGTR